MAIIVIIFIRTWAIRWMRFKTTFVKAVTLDDL